VTSDQAAVPGQDAAPAQEKMYRLPGAVFAWWAWVVFAAANLIDLAVQGRNHTAAEIAATLLVITGLVYACALRPRIIADSGGITVVNPLRDHRVPWGSVSGVDLGESVQVHYMREDGAKREKVIHSWALYARRRNRLRSELMQSGRSRRRLPYTSLGSYGQPAPQSNADKPSAAKVMAAQLDEQARTAREQGADAGARVVHWAWVPITATLAPAILLVLIVTVFH